MTLSNNTRQFLTFLTWIIFLCIVLICITFILFPKFLTLNINIITDNNTLELFRIINETTTRNITP